MLFYTDVRNTTTDDNSVFSIAGIYDNNIVPFPCISTTLKLSKLQKVRKSAYSKRAIKCYLGI